MVRALGSFVSEADGRRFFSGDPTSPFLADAPISARYQRYIIDWLTGSDVGQGVTWHSRLALTPEGLVWLRAEGAVHPQRADARRAAARAGLSAPRRDLAVDPHRRRRVRRGALAYTVARTACRPRPGRGHRSRSPERGLAQVVPRSPAAPAIRYYTASNRSTNAGTPGHRRRRPEVRDSCGPGVTAPSAGARRTRLGHSLIAVSGSDVRAREPDRGPIPYPVQDQFDGPRRPAAGSRPAPSRPAAAARRGHLQCRLTDRVRDRAEPRRRRSAVMRVHRRSTTSSASSPPRLVCCSPGSTTHRRSARTSRRRCGGRKRSSRPLPVRKTSRPPSESRRGW